MGDLPRQARLSRSRDRYRIVAQRYLTTPEIEPARPPVLSVTASASDPLPRPAALTRRDLANLAGDAAQTIWRHCEACTTCPEAPSFGSIIPPIGCCNEGRRLWQAYRKAMADLRAVN
jgi:hypothetical protein